MLSRDKEIWMLETMLRIRYFEESILDLYMQGKVPSLVHLYIGEEAVATGICANLRESDCAFSTHRGHGHNIAKGAPLKELAAEILGKATGCNRGRAGSLRLSCVDVGLLYASPIVGGSVPLAVGAGLSIKLRGKDDVSVAFFGDGASNIGGFHEGLNLASVWKLPVLFICENNLYAISVSTKRSTSVKDIAERAASYSIPGIIVDGNDVLAVYRVAKEAVERARKGLGPSLIECKTYRPLGHHPGDPGTAYRSQEEVEEWKKKDPIKRFEAYLVEQGILSGEEVEGVEERVRDEVEGAMAFALESPFPSPEEVFDFVF